MKPIHAVIAVLVLAAAGIAWFLFGYEREKPPIPPPPSATLAPATDYWGNPRGAAPDIGAVEGW